MRHLSCRAICVAICVSLSASALLLSSCGAPPERRPSKQEIRERLRSGERAQTAGLTGRPSKPPARGAQGQGSEGDPSAIAAPAGGGGGGEGSGGCDELSCLDPALHFAAEGFGATEQEARASAAAELSSRVQSEVQSVVKIRYEERGDGSAAQSGSVDRRISTSFKYGELIMSLPARRGGGQVALVAYLNKADYKERLRRDYGRGLEDLRFQLSDATASGVSDVRFVQSWRAMSGLFGKFDEYVAQHKAVLGAAPEGAEEVDSKLGAANARRRAILGRSEVLITTSGEGAEELGGALAGALQGLMAGWQVRGRAGSACREGALLLSLKTRLTSSTHAVTGDELVELIWEAALSDCVSKEVISSAQMPKLRGAARYSKTARQALVEFVESLREVSQSGEAQGGAPKTVEELRGALEALLKDALPL
jgi:hypothetical protein